MKLFTILTCLRDYLQDPSKQSKTILEIEPSRLTGIKLLIVDFDGVLAAQGAARPLPETMSWLRSTNKKIAILSNKPTEERQRYFSEHYPEIDFFVAQHNKPNPQSIFTLLKKHACTSQESLLIDDRLTTGILAAILANINAIYITRPYVNLSVHYFQEYEIACLRWFECFLVQLFTIIKYKK